MKHVSPFIFALLCSLVINAQTIYVDADATGNNDGTTWQNAYSNLSEAIEAAQSGNELWVAAGIYYPTHQPNYEVGSANQRFNHFTLKNGVTLYGGFAGDETSVDQRDLTAYKTVISGDIDQNDNVGETGYVTTYSDVVGSNSLKLFYFPENTTVDTTAVLDGFVLAGAVADNDVFPYMGGAAFLCQGASPKVVNCEFYGNYAKVNGGAIYIEQSSMIIENCTFSGNYAESHAGAVHFNNTSATLKGCTFTNNSGKYGGAVYVVEGDDVSVIEDCIFDSNEGRNNGGAISISAAKVLLKKCDFTKNTAGDWGGGIVFHNGCDVDVVNCTINSNSATDWGGGIGSIYSCEVRILNTKIQGNYTETGSGGGMGLKNDSKFDLHNVLLTGNKTDYLNGGDAIYLRDGSELTMVNTTMAENNGEHHAILLYTSDVRLDIKNSILWEHGGEFYDNTGGTLTDIVSITNSRTWDLRTEPGCFNDDLVFIDALDYDYAHTDGNWVLMGNSPVNNKGINSYLPIDEWDLDNDGNFDEILPLDLNGNERVFAGVVDLGCYEQKYSPTSGYALTLDGTDDYVELDELADISFGNTMTFECWVNVSSENVQDISIFGVNTDGGGNRRLLSYGKDRGFYIYDPTIGHQISNIFIEDKWVHVAYTINKGVANGSHIYINGEIVKSFTYTNDLFESTDLVSIGQEYDSGLSKGNFFKGKIDEVRIWNDVRTIEELKANINIPSTGNEDDLELYYSFDQVSAGDIEDNAGNTNGTMINGPTLAEDGALLTPILNDVSEIGLDNYTISWESIPDVNDYYIDVATDKNFNNLVLSGESTGMATNFTVAGLSQGTVYYYKVTAINNKGEQGFSYDGAATKMLAPGNALEFDGKTYVQATDVCKYSFPNMVTVECWVKLDFSSVENNNAVWACNVPDDPDPIINNYVMIYDKSNSRFRLYYDGGDFYFDGTGVNEGEWNHIATTINSNVLSHFYLNGVEMASFTPIDPPLPYGSYFSLGQEYDGTGLPSDTTNVMKGAIDEFRVWDDIRSLSEIQTNMNISLSGEEDGLVTYYNFDLQTGSNVLDNANKFDGEIVGNVNWVESAINSNDFVVVASSNTTSGFTLSWDPVAGATDYTIDVANDAKFVNRLITSESTSGLTTYNATGLTQGTKYYIRVAGDNNDTSMVNYTSTKMEVPGNALWFDGKDDYVDISQITEMGNKAKATMECWVYVDPTETHGRFLAINTATGGNKYLLSYQSDNGYQLYDANASTVIGSYDFRKGAWVHLAATMDGADITKFYMNGELVGTASNGHPPLFSGNLISIGQEYDGSKKGDFLKGAIDEVRFWDDIRTQEEIKANMYKTLNGNEANLLAYYNFDQSEGQFVYEKVNGIDGTIEGNPQWKPSNALITPFISQAENISPNSASFSWNAIDGASDYKLQVATDINFSNIAQTISSTSGFNTDTLTGLEENTDYFVRVASQTTRWSGWSLVQEFTTLLVPPGNAYLFDGTNYLSLDDVTNVDYSNGATIELWVKPQIQENDRSVLWANNDNSGGNHYVAVYYSNHKLFKLWGVTGDLETSVDLNNTWNHLAIVLEDGSPSYLYINGKEANTFTQSKVPILANSRFSLAQEWDGTTPSDYYKGSMDEFRIWNRALSLSEIKANYHSSLLGNETGLVGYFNFDEVEGNAVSDKMNVYSGEVVGNANRVESKALITPFTLAATAIDSTEFTANWDNIPGASNYWLRVATDYLLTQPVGGLESLEVGNVNTYDISGLTENTNYYFGVMSYTDRESAWSPGSDVVKTTGDTLGELALKFNDIADRIDLTSHISKVAGKNAGAITGWFKTSTNGELMLISDGTSNNYVRMRVGDASSEYPDESFAYKVRRDANTELLMAVRKGRNFYTDNSWHHFAVVTGDGNNRIIIDGVQQEIYFYAGTAQTQEFTNVTNPNKVWFGYSYSGLLDEIAFYKNPLTNAEVIERAHQKLAGDEIGLVANFTFDNSTAADSSGMGRDGSIVGTVSYERANVLTTPFLNDPEPGVTMADLSWEAIEGATEYIVDVAKDQFFQEKIVNNISAASNSYRVEDLNKNTKYYYRVKAKVNGEWSEYSATGEFNALPGKSLVLDGIDDYVTADGVSDYAADEATYECWVKADADGAGQQAIFALNKASNGYNQVVLAYHATLKRLEIWHLSAIGNEDVFIPENSTDLSGTWHHIALSLKKDALSSLYVDGKKIYEYTPVYEPIVNGYQFSIGQEWDSGPAASNFFKGEIDEFRVWNIALTQEEVRANMNLSEPEGASDHYIAHFTFDEINEGTGFKDLALQNDATIFGGATIQNSEGVIIPITLEADNSTLGAFDMHINDIASAASFEIEVATDETFVPPLAVHENIGRNLDYTVNELCPGVKYYYRARAIYDENTISTWSTPDTVWTVDEDAVIQNFEASQGDYSELLKLSWECTNNYLISDFRITRRIAGASEFDLVAMVQNNTELYQYNDSTAAPGTYYEYAIQGLSYCYNNDTEIDTSNIGYNIPSLELSKEINDDTQEAYIRLDWDYHPDFCRNVEITRINTETGITQTLQEVADSLSYLDADVQLCVPYSYMLTAATTDFGEVDSRTKLFTLEETLKGVFDTLDASKGYSDTKIALTWTSHKQNIIDEYQINRRKYTSGNNWQVVKVIESGTTQVWIDEDANPGEYYEYMIVALGTCGENRLYSDSTAISVGFRQPEGIVSGLVTYKGGNPVADVKVTVNYDETSKNYGSCLEFDGTDSLVIESRDNTFDFSDGMTIEMWARPLSLNAGFVLFKNSGVVIDYTGDGNLAVLSGSALAQYNLKTDAKAVWIDNSWNHIAVRANADSLNILINGTPVATNMAATNLALDASNLVAKDYAGYIDELRIWNIARTDSLIARFQNMMIPREQDNLLTTLRFDENLGSYAFDHTRTGGEANKVHGYLYGATWSQGVPAATKLALAAQTNTSGNYMVNGIWFKGSGETFSVTPAFGVHEFDPGSKSMLISENSLVYGDQNFTDISAFAVNGNVKYQNTTFPVEEVEVLLDGDNIFDIENNIIKTDRDGNFSIEVPIGDHVISVRRDGHYYAEGFYPPRENGEIVLHNFQDDITGLQFIDSTTRIIAGRVIGGAKEGDKEIGFGKSVNNIGQYEIIIKAQREEFGYADTVTTDYNSGEYEFKVIPEVFVVESVLGNPAYMFDLNMEGPIDLADKTATETVSDTVFTENGDLVDTTINEYFYHIKKNWVYRTPMSVDVTKDNGNPVICDSIINPNGTDVAIYSVDGNGNAIYNYGQPVFAVAEPKTLNVIVTEQYTNYQTTETFVAPVTDATVKIKNNLAIDDSQKELALNGDGIASYTFIKGEPNLTEDELKPENSFTKTMEVKAERTGESVDWLPNNGEVYRAIVLGVQVTGTNFVTQGPDRVDFVLRDPPGSNSNSYVEEGFTMERSETKSKNKGFDASLGVFLMVGSFTGGPTFNHESTWTGSNTSTESVTFNTSYSTSDDPAYVGAMGDVFFGRSTNITYGLCKMLSVFPIDSCHPDLPSGDSVFSGHKIGQMFNFALGDEIATTFVFTQNHIENYLIPDLMKLRNNYFVNNPGVYELVNDAEKDEIVPNKGYYNYKGGQSIDSVDLYQASINAWVMELVINEYEKLSADGDVRKVYDWGFTYLDWGLGNAKVTQFGSYQKIDFSIGYGTSKTSASIKRQFNRDENFFNKNISFDAGAIYESSMTTSTETSVERTYEFQTSVGFKSEIESPGIKIPFIGRTPGFKIEASANYNFGGSNTSSSTNSKEKTVGYTLTDGDQGDYFSVDVAKDAYGNGPIFITRGGQSACPYEGATETHFFNEGTLIGSPTMQIEVPTIQADQSMVSNVPEDVPAVFTLKLGNQSEIDADNWFMLMVDVASNPYGAKLKMDGASINNGTAILIPGGKQLTKTLELEKGRADINEYDDIRIIMHSMCQFDPTDDVADIADTVILSAHFVPVCSNVAITNPGDNWLVNVADEDTLDVRISGYDLQLSTFEKFALQYKAESDANWLTDATFFNDTTGFAAHSGNKYDIDGASFMLHSIDMQNLRDRNYQIRAVSVCNDESMFESEPKNGILDGTRPTVFGTPSPADGILSPNDEIMVTFNETVEAGLITQYNFDVQGVLNGSELNHGTSVAFDGNGDYAQTPAGIRLNETDFAIEFWMQKPEDATGTVISQGSEAGGLFKVSFVADSMKVAVGDKVNAAENTFDDGNWHHYAINYNYADLLLAVFVDDKLLLEQSTGENVSEGALLMGMADATNADYFEGNIHDMRIWKRTLAYNEVVEVMNVSLSGNEIGLNAYWPMDEGEGSLLNEKAHSRHANVNAGWNITPASNAYAFNGVDQALVFETGSIPITSEMDFTIEFWFKGDAQNATLFSNGNTSVESGYPEKVVNINVNDAGKIEVETNNEILTTQNVYADDLWHHLAFVVNRRGYANLYIDAEKLANITATAVGSLQGVEAYIGARGYIDNSQVQQFDKYFNGSIDEVRVWSLARTQDQIELYTNYKLSGYEIGLMAYYPFETYTEVMGVMQSEISLSDFSIDPYSEVGLSHCGAALVVGDSTFTNNSPNIKRERAKSKVNFDFVVNDDQIIITPTDELAKIEKCILEITVQNISDIHGNTMASPATWTAYIKKNQVVWGDDVFSLEKELSESLSFTTTIVNEGGTMQSFSISNLPNWLSASPENGTLDPDSEVEVEFTVNDGLNIGNYSEDVYLVSNTGYNERLTLDLRVFKQAPNWVVDQTAYQSSMNVIAQLAIKEVISNDKYDKIGVFSGDVCRGVCNLEYKANYDAYFAFLVVYGNESGEDLSYRVWDASEGRVYSDVAPTYNFEPNKFYGIVATPILFNAGNKLDNTIELNQGWNWLSFNLEMDNASVSSVFDGLTVVDGDIVKHTELFSAYDVHSASWIGSLNKVELGKLYRANIKNGGNLLYMGREAKSSEYAITLVNGWNRIGYMPSENMTVNEALAGFVPQINDVIKSQYQFAMYDGYEWIGSMNYMEAGKGYMYQSNNMDTVQFVYPNASELNQKSASINVNPSANTFGVDAGDYEYVMNATAQVTGEGVEAGMKVGAYLNNELRGVASITNISAYNSYCFINIYGMANELDAEVSFKLIVQNAELSLTGTSLFAGNRGDGNLIAPVVLDAGSVLSNFMTTKNGLVVYPNPFSKELTINYTLTASNNVFVGIYNVLGKKLDVLVDNEMQQGQQALIWDGNTSDGNTVDQGVYFIHLQIGETNNVIRIIKE